MRWTSSTSSMWPWVETAHGRRRSNHSLLTYFLLAFGLSIGFTVGVGFAAEYFDPTIRTPDEAHRLLEVPVLAWLPVSESRSLASGRSGSITD